MRALARIVVIAALLVSGCEASGNGTDDASETRDEAPTDPGTDQGEDETRDDASTDPGTDQGIEDPGPGDPGVDSADPGDLADAHEPSDTPADGIAPGPFGFTIRVPSAHEVPFEDFGGNDETTEAWDIDHVCTFVRGTWNGHFYVQASPNRCGGMIGCAYDTVGAWLSFDGAVQEVPDAYYDFGGNHHNDSVEFTFDNNTYKFYHSTFGWGWRKCQPMDCLVVYDASGMTLVEDGCTPEDRSLPVVCVEVARNGSVPDFPTTFEKCPGDQT
jgi:hypothetical protein